MNLGKKVDECQRISLRSAREHSMRAVIDDSIDRDRRRLQVWRCRTWRNHAFLGREEQFAPIVIRQRTARNAAVCRFEQEPSMLVLTLDPGMTFAGATIANSSDDDGHRNVHRATERSGEDCKIIGVKSPQIEAFHGPRNIAS
jgi:hypothetical protein